MGSSTTRNWEFEAATEVARLVGFPQITALELFWELVKWGSEGRMPDLDKGHLLMLVTLLMGWSWAVHRASVALKGVLQSVVGPSRQMNQGAVVPPFRAKADERIAL